MYNDTKYGRHSHILANWADEGGDIDGDHTCGLRPGQIQRIFQYKFTGGDGEVRSLAMAKIQWYKSHSRKSMYGVGLQLWKRNTFEDFGSASYLPIHSIHSKFAPY